MRFDTFSERQMQAVCWWHPANPASRHDAVICDGAVRSGKSLCLSLSFVLWALHAFDGMSFALCGKTVTALRRNVVAPLTALLGELGLRYEEKASRGTLDIACGGRRNRFHLFGGRDEGSAALIQGVTLAGVLLDEVALMPRSFVEQALARCSVTGSRFWFNCNPEHPAHWFYTEWIQKREEKNAYYLHFRMEDNPSLSPAILKRYQALYTGAFYDRYVLGKWVAAHGAVYPMFDEALHVVDSVPPCSRFLISCDYGTVNPASFGLWGLAGGTWYRIAEVYHDSRREGTMLTDEEYCDALEALAGDHGIECVVVDPSAASFLQCIRRRGRFSAVPAKNQVADGIRLVAAALKGGRLKFHRGCRDTLREFRLYRWDLNAPGDAPVKENDHAMDDIRYFAAHALAGEGGGFVARSAPRRAQRGAGKGIK